MNKDWRLHTGYKGIKSWVWREEQQICVREDFLARKLRFRVLDCSREVARFETLKEAKIDVLHRLLELLQGEAIELASAPTKDQQKEKQTK